MAVRFFSTFQNDVGDYYILNIYDSSFSGAPTELVLSTPGFELTFEGDNQDHYQPIIPSKLAFTVYNEGGNFDTWLNTVVPTASESQFLVEVKTTTEPLDTATDIKLFWRGVLLTEQTQQIDEPAPSAVSFTACDGLGLLDRLEFEDLAIPVGADAGPIYFVYFILKQVAQWSLYGSTDSWLRYFNDFETDGFTGSDFMAESDMSYPYVPGVAPQENYKPAEVLRSLAVTFNARVFMAEGIFYFMPINKFQQRIDAQGADFQNSMYELAANGTHNTLSSIDKITFYNQLVKTNSSAFTKMAGNTIEYSTPVKRVERTRVTLASEYIITGTTGFTTLNAATDDLTFSDDDRIYFEDSTMLVTLNTNININAVSSPNTINNYHYIYAYVTIKVGNQYYTNDGWSATAGDYQILVGTYYKNFGFSEVNDFSIVVEELPSDLTGVDLTLNVKVSSQFNPDLTGSLPTHNVNFVLTLFPGTNSTSPGDSILFASETSLDNSLLLNQGEVVTGNAAVFYGANNVLWNNGSIIADSGDNNSFVSSQTSTGFPMLRLAVREVLSNLQTPHRIRNGNYYIANSGQQIWPYSIISENSELHVIMQLSYSANESIVTVERYHKQQSTSDISFRTDVVKTNDPRSLYAITGVQSLGSQVASNFSDLFLGSLAQYVEVTQIDHTSGSTYIIDSDDNNGFMYMNSYVDASNGFGTIVLPKVADNDGRMLRFKTDSTLHSNKYVVIALNADEEADGVRIDGATTFTMDRDYDGLAVLCHDDQWYIIQKKSKGGGAVQELDGEVLEFITRDTSYTEADYEGQVVKYGSDTLIAGKTYIYASGGWTATDADAENQTRGLLGVALGTNSGTDGLLVRGIHYSSAYNAFTAGQIIYLSTTAGALTTTAPTASGDFVRVVGYALGSRYIYLDPSPDYIEL